MTERTDIGFELVELKSFDLRYEHHRLKSVETERRLLSSIISCGIRDPLQGVSVQDSRILLNGFKRYRCARQLGIGVVPYQSLGCDEMLGIVELLRLANTRSLSIIEQARLIDELKSVFQMSISEIASLLEKSKGWVAMRAGMISKMSDVVMQKLFEGSFPVYSYMYTIRPFMRMNGVATSEVDTFIQATAGNHLSTRDIEILAHGYFKGSDSFRKQLEEGNVVWGLNQLKQSSVGSSNCTGIEQGLLKELEIVQKYMQRICLKIADRRLKNPSFFAQANLLAGGILRRLDAFSQAIRSFYDRSGQT
ncbi:MAG: chromosome partitioning protein ParB [Pseudomonadota bacterium]